MIRHNTGKKVYEAALDRIRFIFKEFPGAPVGVSTSGGKDSTVVFELARIVAKELGIKKFPLLWLDQECEYESTVEYVEWQMNQPEVDPIWLQVPFKLSNATSHTEIFLEVWDDSNPGAMENGGAWMREKHPMAIKENTFGADRFHKLLDEVSHHYFAHGATMTGMRTEESPNRRTAMTTKANYKWLTWGITWPLRTWDETMRHARFAPIYDWTWRDVWKAIHENGWRYNTHYDQMWRYGVSTKNMRVSNYHHETAVWSLFQLQEIEPESYAKATQRLEGIHTYAHLGVKDFRPKELPYMFDTWIEYRDYLIEHLCQPEQQEAFRHRFEVTRKNYPLAVSIIGEEIAKGEALAVIQNDWEFVLYEGWLQKMIPPQWRKSTVENMAMINERKAQEAAAS